MNFVFGDTTETDGDDDNDDEKDENESESEENEENQEDSWETRKGAKRRAFEERRKFKEALNDHKLFVQRAKDIVEESAELERDGVSSGSGLMSEKEIRMRLKKQMKRERQKRGRKKARKTGNAQKARRSLKQEMSTNFW